MIDILKFIEINGLDFTSTGSELNSNCVILAGYACYLELTISELLTKVSALGLSSNATDMLTTVFEYAESHNYGDWWNTEDAKKTYTF